MATTAESSVPKRSFFFHTVFPWLAVLLPAGGAIAAWNWPSDEFDRGMRVMSVMSAGMLIALLITLWLLIYHRLVGWIAAGLIAVLIASLATGAVVMKKDGDLMPTGIAVPLLSSNQSALRAQTHSNGEVEIGIVTEEDFPEYRGVRRDGVVTRPKLARDWKAKPPRLLWRHPVGGGYAGFAVAGNIAVTIEQRQDQEAVVCYDAATGAERWVHAYPASFTEPLGGPGPRATPTIHEGRVYSLGALGKLVCLDASNGKEIWAADILHDNSNLMWAMSGSPLVYRDALIVNPGVQHASDKVHALAAYDRKTGEPRWTSGDTKAGYASPMLAKLDSVEQIMLFDGVEIAGYEASGGKKLWRHPWKTHQDINVAQPLVLEGDRVFVSSGYGVGCAMLHVSRKDDVWSVKELWRNKNLRSKFSSPVEYQGYIYGLDDARLVCLDAKDGERKWKGPRYGHGQMLRCDDLLLILDESGNLVLVEATPQEFRELGSIAAISGRTWNYPALARGKIYVRNDSEMACYDLRE